MRRRLPIAFLLVAAFLLMVSLSACSHTRKPADGTDFALGLAAAAMYTPPSTGETHGKVILPDPRLIRCTTSTCPPVLPDGKDPHAVYPWQVLLDYTNGSVIGLTAFYDQPASIDDVQAAVNDRYGLWARAEFRTGPVRIWRVEPEGFVIQLARSDAGMVQLIYLTFAAKHPTSEKAREEILDRMAKGGNQ